MLSNASRSSHATQVFQTPRWSPYGWFGHAQCSSTKNRIYLWSTSWKKGIRFVLCLVRIRRKFSNFNNTFILRWHQKTAHGSEAGSRCCLSCLALLVDANWMFGRVRWRFSLRLSRHMGTPSSSTGGRTCFKFCSAFLIIWSYLNCLQRYLYFHVLIIMPAKLKL